MHLILVSMELREAIAKRVLQKRKELTELELKVRELTAYVRALEDTLRLADHSDEVKGGDGPQLRPSSEMARTRTELQRAGKPLHISEILGAIGKRDDAKSRVSLASALASYVRKRHIFTRPQPNTFGLVEFGAVGGKISFPQSDPPENFGSLNDGDGPF